MRKVDVYFNETKAGELTERTPGHGYAFMYCPEYLKMNLPPISITFPKHETVYDSEQLFPFFSNMLPEGSNRRTICRTYKIDESDLFGILCIMANKDFIGAVNIKMPQL